jgi:hypothetical protein
MIVSLINIRIYRLAVCVRKDLEAYRRVDPRFQIMKCKTARTSHRRASGLLIGSNISVFYTAVRALWRDTLAGEYKRYLSMQCHGY